MILPAPPPRPTPISDKTGAITQTWSGYFRKIWQRLTPSITPTSITVTGSPFTYTNASGQLQLVWVTGGTITGVTVAGSSVSTSMGMYPVPNGQAIVVTYTAAPTMKVVSV